MNAAERLESLYRAFNARDADTVVAQLDEDVDWPNAWEGGRVRGRDAVREYWARQWAVIDPEVQPLAYDVQDDGSVDVEVRQRVRDLQGALVDERTVRHVYRFRDGLIVQMDVVERPSSQATSKS